ncbi:MAG: hypothetical protein UT29_C0005G0002 [Candidatus Yanofskybacteria bacterium GW2011_GWA1_39_13]|uniref:Uncharacterized protein n=1 Tax=Yanofskybacteria sp. (strain GW2011_GWA1_39_13) TaxID=1619019 RepID=A0A0G0MDJ3_YANXG|nr:MAG: hypothetical protein UT29_C0005G0002 [Candidatus Yanofskybacteria bacterium GW2011_GWA1_39_13]
MEAGEKEVKKALEEVQTRNITTIIKFVEDSRQMILAQQAKIDSLNSQLVAQANLLSEFRIQLAHLQTKVFSGGST